MLLDSSPLWALYLLSAPFSLLFTQQNFLGRKLPDRGTYFCVWNPRFQSIVMIMTAHMLSLNIGKFSSVSAESLHKTPPSMKEAASLHSPMKRLSLLKFSLLKLLCIPHFWKALNKWWIFSLSSFLLLYCGTYKNFRNPLLNIEIHVQKFL